MQVNDDPNQNSTSDFNNKSAPPSGPKTVVCYICGKILAIKIIEFE